MLRIFVFFVVSLVLGAMSWRSFEEPGSHGFFRFFAFEALLVLLLINLSHWFEDPLSWYQIISWVFLCISIYLAITGIALLHIKGGSQPRPGIRSNFVFENTARLVTEGTYGYIRHPMYSSLLFLGWGTFFKSPSWFGVIIALVASGLLFLTAKVEEEENIMTFGPAYEKYMTTTKMLVPFIF